MMSLNSRLAAAPCKAFAPAYGFLPEDTDRDQDELHYASLPSTRSFEVAPTQRNRYFSSYPLAVEQGAIEQGILPLTHAIFELGGYPQFSCEGHPENTGDSLKHTSYVCFWIPPENVPHWNDLQTCFAENWSWVKVKVFVDDSQRSRLGSPFAGRPGQFMSVYFSLRKQWKPTAEAARGQEMKRILSQTHASVASRLRDAAF